ncbi:uncharacterized protein LOC142237724 [Haematobia irritans]|uniref:uncharacterized protein LOC142237724 n=1 Tax=Haematobia irritans TaxID=7368 RepID=UPI003F50757B
MGEDELKKYTCLTPWASESKLHFVSTPIRPVHGNKFTSPIGKEQLYFIQRRDVLIINGKPKDKQARVSESEDFGDYPLESWIVTPTYGPSEAVNLNKIWTSTSAEPVVNSITRKHLDKRNEFQGRVQMPILRYQAFAASLSHLSPAANSSEGGLHRRKEFLLQLYGDVSCSNSLPKDQGMSHLPSPSSYVVTPYEFTSKCLVTNVCSRYG